MDVTFHAAVHCEAAQTTRMASPAPVTRVAEPELGVGATLTARTEAGVEAMLAAPTAPPSPDIDGAEPETEVVATPTGNAHEESMAIAAQAAVMVAIDTQPVAAVPDAPSTPINMATPAVASGDATPNSAEAARRLQHFTDEVQVTRQSPLIRQPPRQKPPTRRQPSQPRSTRAAAQRLAHIPASKRGEVLLMQRMGIPPPPPPITPRAATSRKHRLQSSMNCSRQQAGTPVERREEAR